MISIPIGEIYAQVAKSATSYYLMETWGPASEVNDGGLDFVLSIEI